MERKNSQGIKLLIKIIYESSIYKSDTGNTGCVTFDFKGMADTQDLKASRRWTFTIMNPKDDDYSAVMWLYAEKKHITYMVLGNEICPSTKAPHIQGAVFLDRGYTMKGLKANGFARAHLEKMRGSAKQAIDYCKKDGDFTEVGTPPAQGARTDLKQLAKNVMEGKEKTIVQLYKENPAATIQFSKGMEKLWTAIRNVPSNAPFRKPNVLYIWGTTGLGKSREARRRMDDGPIAYWQKNADSQQWWDGYAYEPGVIFNELRGAHYKLSTLLTWLDGYPFSVQIKCGMMSIQPEWIIITSDRAPERLWDWLDSNLLAQFSRRIDKVMHIEWPGFHFETDCKCGLCDPVACPKPINLTF